MRGSKFFTRAPRLRSQSSVLLYTPELLSLAGLSRAKSAPSLLQLLYLEPDEKPQFLTESSELEKVLSEEASPLFASV